MMRQAVKDNSCLTNKRTDVAQRIEKVSPKKTEMSHLGYLFDKKFDLKDSRYASFRSSFHQFGLYRPLCCFLNNFL